MTMIQSLANMDRLIIKSAAPFKDLDKKENFNFNSVITTENSDPIRGSIPLRCYWCEVKK